MNLDDLISKYLDGELKPGEDTILRQMIAEDKESRNDFDSAVVLSSACREDASTIAPPADLVARTESKILMRILADKPLVEEKLAGEWIWKRRASLVLVSALVLLLGFLKISDFYLIDYKPLMISMFEEEKARIENLADYPASSVPFVQSTEKSRPNPVRVERSSAMIAGRVAEQNAKPSMVSAPAIVQGNDEISFTSDESLTKDEVLAEMNTFPLAVETKQINTVNKTETVSPSNEIAMMTSSPGIQAISPAKTKSSTVSSFSQVQGNGNFYNPNSSPLSILQLSALDFYPVKTEVQLNTIFGSDLARIGLNVNNEDLISHVSQGIAYPIDKDNLVGVELGYTSFSFNDKMVVSRPVALSDGMLESVEVNNPGDEESTFINVVVPFKRTKQMVWGTAFYERKILDYGAFNLNGRIGLGASGDGMMSFGRLFGKYSVIPGLSLTLGADGRIFKAQFITKSSSSDNWRGTISLVYGLQFNF